MGAKNVFKRPIFRKFFFTFLVLSIQAPTRGRFGVGWNLICRSCICSISYWSLFASFTSNVIRTLNVFAYSIKNCVGFDFSRCKTRTQDGWVGGSNSTSDLWRFHRRYRIIGPWVARVNHACDANAIYYTNWRHEKSPNVKSPNKKA